jgi:predicted MPP superfamily phosphohydrolase
LPVGRRDFLARSATGAAFVVGPASSLYGFALGRHDYTIEELVAKLPGLPRALDGYTLVQLSDIHFGRYVGETELASAVDLVRSARPDAVVLTGDLLDHDIGYRHFLGRLVERLGPLARDGLFAIPGNHDYYAGVDDVLDTIRRAGGRVLRNGAHSIGDGGGRFALLGVDDVWAPRQGYGLGPDLDAAIAAAPRDVPRVLLCHNPEFFPEAAPKVDLMLSGHTHGGQVQLGLNPAELVVPFGYVSGEYRRGESTLYVNRGFGTAGPPARVGSPPEVTRIVLTGA